MNTKQKIKLIAEEIKGMKSNQIMQLNNILCEDLNASDDRIYFNDEEFFKIFFPSSYKAIQAAFLGCYKETDKFVQFNGYGNLVSFNFLNYDNLPDSLPNMIDCILENPKNYKHLFNTKLI